MRGSRRRIVVLGEGRAGGHAVAVRQRSGGERRGCLLARTQSQGVNRSIVMVTSPLPGNVALGSPRPKQEVLP